MWNGWIMKLFCVAGPVVDTEVTLEVIRSHCAGAVQMCCLYWYLGKRASILMADVLANTVEGGEKQTNIWFIFI